MPTATPMTAQEYLDVALELARGDELASPLLPGFSLPLGALFDE